MILAQGDSGHAGHNFILEWSKETLQMRAYDEKILECFDEDSKIPKGFDW